MYKIISLLILLALFPNISLGQSQEGDECADPFIASDGANYFDTTTATPSTPEPDEAMCPGTELNWNNSQDIWFKYTPLTTGTHTFTTCDPTSYDTSMALYDSSCSNQVACNGDDISGGGGGCQSYFSTITYTLLAGNSYYIRIGGWNGAVGTGTLTIDPASGGGSDTWYVDVDNIAPGDGSDWVSAFTDLQDALDVAVSGDQIWIAEGTYIPSDLDGSSDAREASFRIIAGVEIYGGFQGNEADIDLRRPSLYRVFLSGDLAGDDGGSGDNSENAYHVVTADNLVGASPILDSVYIGGGNANSGGNNKYGGGLIVENYSGASLAYPIVRQTSFVFNEAHHGGAIAIVDADSGVLLTWCVLSNNTANSLGGAILNSGSCRIDNCLLVSNYAKDAGGAVFSNGSEFTSIGSTIVQNGSDFVGGLGFNGGINQGLNNIIWGNTDVNGNNDQIYLAGGTWTGNYNCIENFDNGLSGPNTIIENPRFVSEFGNDGVPATGDENFRLIQQSPCIDSGDNAVVVEQFDIEGNDRLYDDPYTLPNGGLFVDMGAYEHVDGSNSVWIWSGANGSLFHDAGNWLPNGIPDAQSNVMFNSYGFETVIINQSANLNMLLVTEGYCSIELQGNTLFLDSESSAIKIDSYDTGASVVFKQGTIRTNSTLKLDGGDISFRDITHEGSMWLGNDTELAFSGTNVGDVTNEGSTLSTAGRDIGSFDIQGTLVNQSDSSTSGQLVGSLPFDINGRSPGTTHDYIDISSFADMSCSIDLRWNTLFTPVDGDGFDLMTVGTATSQPSVIFSSGLRSDLGIRWTNPTPLRTGDEVILETTGPILFESNQSHALTSQTPNEIVVADFDGDSDPDIAMVVPVLGGGNGNVIILLNNGVSGDVWQGFTEQLPISVGQDPIDIALIDIDGNGTATDLAVANYSSNSVSVLTNDGTGTFTASHVALVGDTGPKYIAVANYKENGDLLDDIAVACDSFDISILENTSTLISTVFTHTSSIGIPLPGDILPGDVNNDKGFDYVVLNIASDSVQVYEGDGTGTFPPFSSADSSPLPAGSTPAEFAYADLDGDGDDDLITVNEGNAKLSILIDTGINFGNTSSIGVGSSPQEITVADFDNDLDDDLVISVVGDVSGNRELTVIRNDTDTINSPSTIVLSEGDSTASGSEPIMIAHGDFDSDGLEDLVAVIDLAPIRSRANSPAIGVYFNTTAVVGDCPADIDGDGSVAVGDILAIISAWGTVDPALDIDESGLVDVGDILAVVSNWGVCQ
ncbi:MAG: VCBS repeat-containing protein [Phycisphaerales bacterium]|nr:VCBS repeat-containing protein [Planctomycetota bacterium]MBL6997444.1 VCBS repeat-containing protein [Phycisphaerales bacterium]